MFRTILVPLDGSTFAEHSLPFAVTLARKAGGRVVLLLVHRMPENPYAEIQLINATLDDDLQAQERTYLDMVQGRVKDALPGAVSTLHAEGEPAETIREEVVKANADLVVLTTHARGPFTRFWLGSTTDQLVRKSRLPLLIVHPSDAPADVNAEVCFRHLLVPLDGTPLAEKIIEPALNLAQVCGADLTLLRVVQSAVPVFIPPEAGMVGDVAQQMAAEIGALQGELEKEASAYLDGAASRGRARGLTVKTRVAAADQPARAILDAAQTGVDIIALSTHGRGGLSRLLLGSVADKVIRGAHVPVLVQHPGD